jgi:hypothetical protein
VSQASRRQFQSSLKILQSFELNKKLDPLFSSRRSMKRPDALLSLEDSNKLRVASVRTSRQDVRTLFIVREESSFPLQTRIGKDSYNRLDARATSFGRGLNMETREVRERPFYSSSSGRSMTPSGCCLEKSESIAI